MAKDDYDKLVCTILLYLYARLRKKTDVKPEEYLQAQTKDFPVDEEYFNYVLENIVKSGFVDGINVIREWGGDIVGVFGISHAVITPDGIHYLKENGQMRRVLEFLCKASAVLPGLVTTALDILN